ncbi:hypothetical protein E3G42_003771 [Mycobacteroides abscessus]|nr:hypothetical protein E3G42_003771 [Mycobacteroides abscessus]
MTRALPTHTPLALADDHAAPPYTTFLLTAVQRVSAFMDPLGV